MKKQKSQEKWNIELLPLLAVILIVPLVTGLHIMDTGLGSYPWLPDSMEQRADFFLYGKSRVLLILAGVMLLGMIDRFLIRREGAGWKCLLPLVGYELFVVLSSVLSDERRIALHGIMEQYEGMWVLLAYGVIAAYAFFVVHDSRDLDCIWLVVLTAGLLQGILGLAELAGKELLSIPLFKKLILGKNYQEFADRLDFRFVGESYQRVSGTLYNPNYAGIFFAVVFFAGLCLLVKWTGGKRAYAILVSIVSLICLIGSGSKSAVIALLVTIPVFAIKAFLSGNKKAGVLCTSGFVLVIVFFCLYDGLTGMHTLRRIAVSLVPKQTDEMLTDIRAYPDHIALTWDGRKISLVLEHEKDALYIHAYEEDGNELTLVSDEKRQICSPEETDFEQLYFQCYRKNDISYLAVFHNNIRWLFAELEDGTYSYITIWGKPDEIITAKKAFSGKWDSLFTNRGYIYNRTLPLLKKYIIFGSGPDTFILQFPQNDYVARAALGWGFFSEILTKPHCIYLQIALQTGVLSLILFLVLPVSIWINNLKKSIKNRAATKEEEVMRSDRAIISGFLLIYLLAGLTHDSMLVLAPLYWVILGAGLKKCFLQFKT